ncbi:hypothetical protein BIW11_04101 [Tropilaelaps mercedesae]|uniref:Uncharacterized protein n=1 Tax=Tropilaelaps mercedesae TaxID=418985 RepID=A0A1V9XB38_9ACAR|nr:hypothetical protein BIW11_04101 [Tropilaelaps mercedesae]
MCCSAVTLSLATITAVLGLLCLTVAFGTDSWMEIRVNRTLVRNSLQKDTDDYRAFETQLEYFSRDVGLLRICFPDKRPKTRRPVRIGFVRTLIPAFLSLFCPPTDGAPLDDLGRIQKTQSPYEDESTTTRHQQSAKSEELFNTAYEMRQITTSATYDTRRSENQPVFSSPAFGSVCAISTP